MKDTQLRGLVLQRYYEKRREKMFLPKPSDFDVPITEDDILAISDQLGQQGLIEWRSIKHGGVCFDGAGQINSRGIGKVEAETKADIKAEPQLQRAEEASTQEDIILLKPTIWGIGVDLNALRRWWNRRKKVGV